MRDKVALRATLWIPVPVSEYGASFTGMTVGAPLPGLSEELFKGLQSLVA